MTTKPNRTRLFRGAASMATAMLIIFLAAFGSAAALPCPVQVTVVDDAGILSATNYLTVAIVTPSYSPADTYYSPGVYSIPRTDSVTAAQFAFPTLYRPSGTWSVTFNFPAYPGFTEQSFLFEDHATPKHQYKAIVSLTWDATTHCPKIHILIVNA